MVFRFFIFIFTAFCAFLSVSYAIPGAGIAPMVVEDRDGAGPKLYMRLGRETRHLRNGRTVHVFSDFGGGEDPNEQVLPPVEGFKVAAIRECFEETAHTINLPGNALNNVHYVDQRSHVSGDTYRLFFPILPNLPLIQDMRNSAAILGPHAHVEKTEWMDVHVVALLSVLKSTPPGRGNFPKMPGTNDNLYGPFVGCLKKATPWLERMIAIVERSAPQPVPTPAPMPTPTPQPSPVPVVAPQAPQPVFVKKKKNLRSKKISRKKTKKRQKTVRKKKVSQKNKKRSSAKKNGKR